MFLAHLWLNRVSSSSARSITGFNQKTITRFYKHFRRLVASTLDIDATVIGGPGIVIELDETKLGKRKYHRGHRVDGVWVVVGVERTPERRVFMVPVADRSAETLTQIVLAHVAAGSIVHTDGWRGYAALQANTDLEHRVVNHSVSFVDSQTGVHTNTVEGTNFALKRHVPIRCRIRDEIEGHLFEFVWRREHENSLWNSFIVALREVHYDLE